MGLTTVGKDAEDGGGLSLTVTLTGTPAAAAPIFAFLGIYDDAGGGSPSTHSLVSLTDSQGGTWDIASSSPHANIGNTSTETGDSAINIIGQVRTAGTDLSAGDTVTATWNDNLDGHAVHLLGIISAGSGLTISAVGQDQGSPYAYGNGDTYPGGVSAAALNWTNDLGSSFVPTPDADAVMITAAAALPGVTGYSPVNGSLVDEIVGTDWSLHVTCDPAASGPVEPGGSWPSGRTMTVANYQFAETVAPAGYHVTVRLS